MLCKHIQWLFLNHIRSLGGGEVRKIVLSYLINLQMYSIWLCGYERDCERKVSFGIANQYFCLQKKNILLSLWKD